MSAELHAVVARLEAVAGKLEQYQSQVCLVMFLETPRTVGNILALITRQSSLHD
jgi:hypothetical protein